MFWYQGRQRSQITVSLDNGISSHHFMYWLTSFHLSWNSIVSARGYTAVCSIPFSRTLCRLLLPLYFSRVAAIVNRTEPMFGFYYERLAVPVSPFLRNGTLSSFNHNVLREKSCKVSIRKIGATNRGKRQTHTHPNTQRKVTGSGINFHISFSTARVVRCQRDERANMANGFDLTSRAQW